MPALHQLVARLVAAAAPLCVEGSTLVVVYDRQSTTPQQKAAATQAKRHKVSGTPPIRERTPCHWRSMRLRLARSVLQAERKYIGEEAIALLVK